MFVQDGQREYQGSCLTFDIGDLIPFEIEKIVLTSCFESRSTYDFCLRYELLFEMEYFLFETGDFLFKSRLFAQDGNFLFEKDDFYSSSA